MAPPRSLCHFSSRINICPEHASQEIKSSAMTPSQAGRGRTPARGASACRSPPSISARKRLQRLGLGVGGVVHICHALALYSPPEGSLSSCVDQVMLLLVMATFSDHPQFWGLDRNSIPTPSFFFFLILSASLDFLQNQLKRTPFKHGP